MTPPLGAAGIRLRTGRAALICSSGTHSVESLAQGLLLLGLAGAIQAVGVEQGGVQAGQADVPDVARPVLLGVQQDLMAHPPLPQVCLGEQAQPDLPGVGGEQRKVGGALRGSSNSSGRVGQQERRG